MNVMKKFLLSALVLGIFVVYAIHTKLGGDDNVQAIAIKPPNSGSTPQATPQPTVASGNGPTPTSTPLAQSTPTPVGKYKDGTYTGSVADAFYGNIQVQAVISGGKITSVNFLQAPSDRRTSTEINSQADPLLAQEAIQAQSAQVSGVTGATASSDAFVQSLQNALQQAM